MIRTILFRLGLALAAFAILWFLTGSAIVTLVLGALIAALVWVPHHFHGDGNPPPGTTRRQRIRNWLGAVRLTLGDIRRNWYRLQDWVQHLLGRDAGAAVPVSAAPRPPAPLRPAGAAPAAPVLEPVPLDVTPAEIPPAFTPVLAHISGFEAEHDTDLLAFTRGLGAGELAMGEALEAQLDHCLTVLRLDPVALQGLADFADSKADHAQAAVQIGRMINAVYAEIQAFRASGGVLPKDGDFLTGDD